MVTPLYLHNGKVLVDTGDRDIKGRAQQLLQLSLLVTTPGAAGKTTRSKSQYLLRKNKKYILAILISKNVADFTKSCK